MPELNEPDPFFIFTNISIGTPMSIAALNPSYGAIRFSK